MLALLDFGFPWIFAETVNIDLFFPDLSHCLHVLGFYFLVTFSSQQLAPLWTVPSTLCPYKVLESITANI